MAVLINKTQGRFTVVSQGILEDKKLSLEERGLLVTLISFPNYWVFSIRRLCKIIPDGKQRVSRVLNSLIEKGYVTRIQNRGDKGRFGSTDLEVHETPVKPRDPSKGPDGKDAKIQQISDIPPCPENRDAVNQNTDKRNTDSRPQYNIKQSNTNESNIHKVCSADTLTDDEYDSLVSEFGKSEVDYQISRIRDHGYKGCINVKTIRKWCLERQDRDITVHKNQSQKNSFCDFEQHTIDFEALKARCLAN